jgi:Ni,Fe-hydrogenase III small subunit
VIHSPLSACLALSALWVVLGLSGLLRPRSLGLVRVLFPLGALCGVTLAAIALISLGAPTERLVLPIRAVLGRALCIRHVDAGSCNGCGLEIQALNNPLYNLEGLGIRFVASPRHADLLLVTGPVSKHMESALKSTYAATPDPKIVVALGDCGCTGGIFGENYASRGRVANVIPVDVAIPGCPPSPTRILEGILAALERSARAAPTRIDGP